MANSLDTIRMQVDGPICTVSLKCPERRNAVDGPMAAALLDLIPTRRPVGTAEALAMGLANRVVEPNGALSAAQQLAREIAGFGQSRMRTDRASTYAGLDLPLAGALRAEGAAGNPIVLAEGACGAQKFVDGAGRHGY